MIKVSLIVPTLNPGEEWLSWLNALEDQDCALNEVLVVDSCSDIDIFIPNKMKFKLVKIQREEFNHGGTRQFAVSLLDKANIIVFLTQDAILADKSSITNIVKAFEDPIVGASFGRQVAHKNATRIAQHARQFNYPQDSYVREGHDIKKYGLKTAFISNSFAAYRYCALQRVGGFSENVILGEDTLVASKMLLNGLKVAYVSDAIVYHSHNYSFFQEFSRYFDIGVFHSEEGIVLKKFKGTVSEGRRFVLSELHFLLIRAPWTIPSAILRTILKYSGYTLGCNYRKLPKRMIQKISMHKMYWC